MDQVIGGHRVVVQELLHGGGHVTLGRRRIGQVGHRVGVVIIASAPRIVPIVRHEHDRRVRRVVVGRDVGVDLARSHGRIAVAVAQEVPHRDDRDLVHLSRLRIYVLGPVRLIAIRRSELASPTVNLSRPPVVTCRGHLIGRIGRIDVAPVGPEDQGVVRQCPGKVTVGDDAPFESFLHEYGNDPLREGTLRGPVALAVSRAERLGVDVLVHPDFLAQDLLGNQGRQHVVETEGRQVHAPLSAGSRPIAGGREVLLPAGTVSPLIGIGQTVHVLDEAA